MFMYLVYDLSILNINIGSMTTVPLGTSHQAISSLTPAAQDGTEWHEQCWLSYRQTVFGRHSCCLWPCAMFDSWTDKYKAQ